VPRLEVLVFAAVLALALVALWRLGVRPRRLSYGLAAVVLALGLGVAFPPRQGPARDAELPIRVEPGRGFASSDACRSCHPTEYRSWHESYHRSMTEEANGSTLRAPWDGVLDWRGRSYTLTRRGDELWVTLPDPDRVAALARQGRSLIDVADVERRVVMTTGSHHYQAYWVPGARGNELWQFPFVYHFESQRFIPRHAAFLQPEDDPVYFARWNSNCIQCHSVAGEPRHDLASDRFDSRVAELGIACEACHGPGATHADQERDPLVRMRQRETGSAPDIVNPARLDAERGSQVCGQCHAYFMPRDAEAWWTSGFTGRYRPGDDLNSSRRLLALEPGAPQQDPEIDASLDSLFYPDGTIRVGGREWNGLVQSACFSQGQGARQLSCTSCHQMHGGSRDDQLEASAGADGACQGCHSGYGPEHTRHRAGSSGSECMNCHMPRTTYALFKGIRSHRISVPVVDSSRGAALNACTLCHQDRSLDWTSRELSAWSTPSAPGAASSAGAMSSRDLPSDAAAVAHPSWSALAVAALSGDAAARVIAAFELGALPAREVSGASWQAQVLVEALDDPYAAVRFVALRSLRSFPGFADFEFDFVAPRERRLERQALARARAADSARRARGASPGRPGVAPLPSDPDGLIQRDVIERLRSERDDRPIRIAE
jgi:predicted CXXCH cytochrome family protein